MNHANSGPDDLAKARERLFVVLLKRMRQLYFSRPIPEGFYVGQDYVEDMHTIECMIGADFIFPGVISRFEFMLHGARILGVQHENILGIRVYRSISQRLWNDLKYIGAGPCERFIVAYLAAYMPRINRFLLDNRYDNGHLLSRTFTILDATTVCVIVGTELVWINWPISFSNFPPSAAIAHQVNALYVRDFIDAMASYFRGEFDDCIRRVITSVENFFQSKNWTTQVIRNGFWRALLGLKHRTRSVKFRRILLNNLELNTLFGEVVNSNMRLIYGTRNRIVHHGLRLGTSSGLFCDKAISTAYYLMYHYCGDPLIRRYLYTLNMQFTMLKSVLGTLYNLDAIERSKGFVTQGPVIETPQDMDRFMFESLRFDNRDKQSIYR